MHSSHIKYKKLTEFNRKIILVDVYTDLNNIKKKFQSDDYTIISFDFESHQKLLNEKITHELSDNYISDSQCASIQNYVYKFASWFSQSDYLPLLEYRKINLGGLYGNTPRPPESTKKTSRTKSDRVLIGATHFCAGP